jgi:hypothetical protein
VVRSDLTKLQDQKTRNLGAVLTNLEYTARIYAAPSQPDTHTLHGN